MNTKYAIVGAGCAGLSLAVHLTKVNKDFDLKIIDQRDSFGRDRTWCFWPTEKHPFQTCIKKEWNTWTVSHNGTVVKNHSSNLPYQMIPSDMFYDYALNQVNTDSRMELHLGSEVQSIERDSGQLFVKSDDNSAIKADYVFDSRPDSNHKSVFYQHFIGWFVESGYPAFDTSRVKLMDFWRQTDNGIHFMYQLPFTDSKSLFEATWFSSDKRLEKEVYESAIRDYLDKHKPDMNYSIYHREQGSIPLDPYQTFEQPEGIIPIGSKGGATRASTGYTFMGIQRASRRISRAIARGTTPFRPKIWSRKSKILDMIFMSYLEKNPERGPELFIQLFRKANAEAVVRFLSDRANIIDYIDVMTAMPKLSMIKESLSLIKERFI